jgi:hypothetical protein
MASEHGFDLDRRDLLTRVAPACAMALMGLCKLPEAAFCASAAPGQDPHKFDAPRDRTMSLRQQMQREYRQFIGFIQSLQTELEEPKLIRLLNGYSADVGRSAGAQQAQASPDTDFQTFVSVFRPPRYANMLTHEIVVDEEKVFQLRVTECIWAEIFQQAGLGGEIGHAAVCNMDYYWPTAFNPNFRMERTRTLMQGHDQCNHRYLDTA